MTSLYEPIKSALFESQDSLSKIARIRFLIDWEISKDHALRMYI